MKNESFLSADYERRIDEALKNPDKWYHIAFLKVNYTKPSIYHAMTYLANGEEEDSLRVSLYDGCAKMLKLINTKIDDPEWCVKSIIIEIAKLGYLSHRTIDAIYECLNGNENLDKTSMCLRIYEPWLLVNNSENLSNEELNEKIFKDMIKTIQPEKTLEAHGFRPPSWVVDTDRLLHLVSAYVANVAYNEIIKSVYFQLENKSTFLKAKKEIDGLHDYSRRVLVQISDQLGVEVIRDILKSKDECPE